MVCPICIATAVAANAPFIAAAFGGAAAVKLGLQQRSKVVCEKADSNRLLNRDQERGKRGVPIPILVKEDRAWWSPQDMVRTLVLPVPVPHAANCR